MSDGATVETGVHGGLGASGPGLSPPSGPDLSEQEPPAAMGQLRPRDRRRKTLGTIFKGVCGLATLVGAVSLVVGPDYPPPAADLLASGAQLLASSPPTEPTFPDEPDADLHPRHFRLLSR